MAKIIAIFNIKGGVGKTASAVNLSYLAASEGAKTLLWDLDTQGSASFYFRVKPKVKGGIAAITKGDGAIAKPVKGTDFENLDLLPADFSYRDIDLYADRAKKPLNFLAKLLKPLEQDYQYIFLDCPPSISRTSAPIFSASDMVLVPAIPTILSIRALTQLARFVRKNVDNKARLFSFFSITDLRKKMHQEICQTYQPGKTIFLRNSIPNSAIIEKMGLARAPVPVFAPNSEPAFAYRRLWQEVKQKLDAGPSIRSSR